MININTNDQTYNIHQNKIHANQIPTNNSNKNFASLTPHEYTSKRDQAIVFNYFDGVPHNEHIVAIGHIILPKNIAFVSRISNNRYGIFLTKNIF